jgi:predicted Zn-dependent peptidase
LIQKYYDNIGETVIGECLENGLATYVFHKPNFEKTFAFFATNYGGMDTRFLVNREWQDTPMGVAHFLEHKMFDTKDGNALQLLSAKGASPNAFTGSAITGYYFEGSEGFYENLETLLSFVSVPYFTKESVEKEQGIIGQEIQMIEDNPNWQAYMNLLAALYHKNPIRNSVAGTKDSIAQITADTLYLCHKTFYQPSNMVLCVAGNVDPERVYQIAKKILPKGGAGKIARDYGGEEPEHVCEEERSLSMEVSIPILQLGFKLKPAEDGRSRLHQKLIGDLLCEAWMGSSSPLYERLYREGLINSGFFYGYESYHGIAFILAGGESRDPAAVREAILQEAERIGKEGLDEGLFRRLKKAAYGNQLRALNSFEYLCVEQARAHFAGEDIWIFPKLYDMIHKEDLEKALGEWISRERTAMAVIRPKEAGE